MSVKVIFRFAFSGYAWTKSRIKSQLAVKRDDEPYELLAIIDTIRGGKARERKLAIDAFREKLDRYTKAK